MLRRYLIVNGISTVLMYGAVMAFVPSISAVVETARQSFYSFAMDSTLLAPLVYRMAATVSGR